MCPTFFLSVLWFEVTLFFKILSVSVDTKVKILIEASTIYKLHFKTNESFIYMYVYVYLYGYICVCEYNINIYVHIGYMYL